MVLHDFDKFTALVSVNPKYNEQSVFYGPFEGMIGIILYSLLGMCGSRENSFVAYYLFYILLFLVM
jgi:hypothetical protein